jgi:hypothetical protein
LGFLFTFYISATPEEVPDSNPGLLHFSQVGYHWVTSSRILKSHAVGSSSLHECEVKKPLYVDENFSE